MRNLDHMHYFFNNSTLHFRCFCNDFFWLFTHNFWTINISGFGKWSYLNNIHLDKCYWWKMPPLHLHLVSLHISQLFLQTILSQHSVADNSSYNSSTQILQIPCCDVFPEKHLSAWCYIVNIFSVALLLKLLLNQNKLIRCALLAFGILNILYS